MAPISVKTVGTTLEKTENAVTATLVHMKKLLRLRNWLHSPLLRLPTEIIVRILSHIMEYPGCSSNIWRPIFSTCHHIRIVMYTATELWGQANFTLDRLAPFVFARSQGNLQAITVDFLAREDDYIQDAMCFCRDNLVLHGHRLHTLDVHGDSSDVTNFSWIFERPLPRLEHVGIHFFGQWSEWDGFYMQDPVILQLPADLPLRVLSLSNATLPWSSYRFAGLRELHLDFAGCSSPVEISEEELLGMFDGSPRLESLSLLRLTPRVPVVDNQRQYTPTRIAKFTSLASLTLGGFPQLVDYVLAHVDIPAIDFLDIRIMISLWEVEPFLANLFPDGRLPNRLFQNPPIFEIGTECSYGDHRSLKVKIGGTHIQFDCTDGNGGGPDTIVTSILSLVPQSITVLRLDYSGLGEGEWMEFFRSHSELRSIESTRAEPVSKSLWNSLAPVGVDAVTLCPKLESISLPRELASAPLVHSLLNRKSAGYGLRHLRLRGMDDSFADGLSHSVEELQVVKVPNESRQKWRSLRKAEGWSYI